MDEKQDLTAKADNVQASNSDNNETSNPDNEISQLGQPSTAISSSASSPKKFNKSKVYVLTLIGLIAVGVVLWLLVFNNPKKAEAPVSNVTTDTNSAQVTSNQPAQKKISADKIIYAYSNSGANDLKIYSRPAGGGDKKELLSFTAGEIMESYSVRGQSIALAITGGSPKGLKIMFSSDGGVTFKPIYQKANSELQVTSLMLSDDASSLTMALLETPASKNKVYEVPLDGSGSIKELFTAATAGVAMYSYSTKTSSIVFSEGCWNCDGFNNKEIFSYDINAKARKSLYQSPIGGLSLGVTSDGTEMIVAEGSKYTGPPSEGLGGPITQPPYKFISVNIKSGDKKQVGETNDKVQDVGYISNVQPYYVSDKKVEELVSTPVTKFEADKQISEAAYVSDTEVVVATGVADAYGYIKDYSLSTFKLTDKSIIKVLEGDQQTTIIGVTSTK